MKLLKMIYFFGLIFLMSCNNQPKELSNVKETIEISYVNWACDCPNFIETKYFKNNSEYEVKAEDCIYIESLNKNHEIPNDFYNKKCFEYYLKLRGQFYVDQGTPKSYKEKTPEKPQKARVFRYDSFQLIKK